MLSVTDNSQGARGDVKDVAADSPNSEANLSLSGGSILHRKRPPAIGKGRKQPAQPGRFTRPRRSIP